MIRSRVWLSLIALTGLLGTSDLSAQELEALGKSYNLDEIFQFLKNDPAGKKFVEKAQGFEDITFYKAAGCDQCGGEGYRGRNGVYEVLPMDTDIRKLVTQTATTEDIEKQAKKNGMSTMVEDGFLKIVQGITTIEEIMRATKE